MEGDISKRVWKSFLKEVEKDRRENLIVRGIAVLVLVAVAYLFVLAGFGVWRIVAWLLILSFLMGVAIIDTQRIMKWTEDIRWTRVAAVAIVVTAIIVLSFLFFSKVF